MAEYEIEVQGHPGGNNAMVLRGAVSAVVLLALLSKLRRSSIPVLSVTIMERAGHLKQERPNGYGLVAHSI